mmetsp:Transcript_2334/g.6901  ORF Transcript_2334/g.6901 Transcript_2334/m.6901 type:complete len:217 (-) Transcript_2334:119-769(-)
MAARRQNCVRVGRSAVAARARPRHGPRQHGHAVRRSGPGDAGGRHVPQHAPHAARAAGVVADEPDGLRAFGRLLRHAHGRPLAAPRVRLPQFQGRAHDSGGLQARLLRQGRDALLQVHEAVLQRLAVPGVRLALPDARRDDGGLRPRRGGRRGPGPARAGARPGDEHDGGLRHAEAGGVPREADRPGGPRGAALDVVLLRRARGRGAPAERPGGDL